VTRFELAVVHAAAKRGRVRAGGPRFKARLLPYVPEYVQMIAFTESVLLELREHDFMKTLEYEGVEYDAYGVAISRDLQQRFGIEGLETWYVKLTMDEDDDGGEVLVVSLHEPEGALRRSGGTLPVRFRRTT
jgi:hypothetical protein